MMAKSIRFRITGSFMIWLFIANGLFGQSPYQLDWKREAALSTIGVSGMIIGNVARKNVTLFAPEELERLDRYTIGELDRIAVRYQNPGADEFSDYLMIGSQALPALFLTGARSREHFGQIAVMYSEVIVLTAGVTALTKYAIRRPRPYVYYPETSTQQVQSENAQASFISGHTSATAAATFFTARVFADMYPESSWKPVVWTAAAAIPALTGYFRVRAGKHYPTDVMAGYLAGAAIGYFVPVLHRQKKGKLSALDFNAFPGYTCLTWTF